MKEPQNDAVCAVMLLSVVTDRPYRTRLTFPFPGLPSNSNDWLRPQPVWSMAGMMMMMMMQVLTTVLAASKAIVHQNSCSIYVCTDVGRFSALSDLHPSLPDS